MGILITGSTGYLGSYIVSELLQNYRQNLLLLVRSKDQKAATVKLWRAMQLHMNFSQFQRFLTTNVKIFLGDLTEQKFGLGTDDYQFLIKEVKSILHVAASLNRKSEKACLNVNLRGTLEVAQLARNISEDHKLKRFSHVSTVAVAGMRQNQVIAEDEAIDWNISDYDPYARTKKFCEHLIRELLPDIPLTIFRPSIVLGDSRQEKTTQFDMVQAFAFLAGLTMLPLRPADRLDIVNVNFVAQAITQIHQKENPCFDTYHLSSGIKSQTCQQITDALSTIQNRRKPFYLPSLINPVKSVVHLLAKERTTSLGQLARLLEVFLPYLLWNTVFNNNRIVQETGLSPARFTDYCHPLYEFATKNHFKYPYQDLPAAIEEESYDGSSFTAVG